MSPFVGSSSAERSDCQRVLEPNCAHMLPEPSTTNTIVGSVFAVCTIALAQTLSAVGVTPLGLLGSSPVPTGFAPDVVFGLLPPTAAGVPALFAACGPGLPGRALGVSEPPHPHKAARTSRLSTRRTRFVDIRKSFAMREAAPRS